MSVGAVAERYAQAIFELGVESGKLAAVADKLRDFSATYESSRELRAALTSPVLKKEERRALLSAVAARLDVPDLAVKCLLVMADRSRLPALAAMAVRLTQLVDNKEGILRASVTTAAAMPESYFQTFSAKLAAATGKKIILERSIDKDLVGGAIARVGDSLIDGSVRGKLQQMERKLLSAMTAGAS
jgi:F-type H+-transporting ATPase subunit delta